MLGAVSTVSTGALSRKMKRLGVFASAGKKNIKNTNGASSTRNPARGKRKSVKDGDLPVKRVKKKNQSIRTVKRNKTPGLTKKPSVANKKQKRAVSTKSHTRLADAI